jgi:uncharacterized protein YndB with AHSA1/START domain
MGTQLRVEAKAVTRASRELVWSMVSDASAYARWGPWDASGEETSDDGGGEQGVGSVRWMRLGRTRTVERILEIEPAHRLVYTVVRGVPVRNYRAEVVLDPLDSGTAIRWIATWDRTILGRIVHRRLATFYPEMVNQLVASADAATATGGGGA